LTKTRLSQFIADAYQLMGDAHVIDGRQQKNGHAVSAYTLALLHDPERQDVREALADCLALGQPVASKGTTTDIAATSAVTSTSTATTSHPMETNATPATDIEDLLGQSKMLTRTDRVDFSCTMCGECCRHADYIYLSSIDVWRLFQAKVMQDKKKQFRTTKQKAQTVEALNNMLDGALQWTSKNGVPICYLSPKKRQDRCAFAYPLYRTNTKVPGSDDVHNQVEKKNETTELVDPITAWNIEKQELARQQEDNDESFVPVSTSEYDFSADDFEAWQAEERREKEEQRVTTAWNEEEHEMADNEDDDDEDDDDEDDDEDSEAKDTEQTQRSVAATESRLNQRTTTTNKEDDDQSSNSVSQSLQFHNATPILNTFGRKALGCSLGSSHMPTMCSSYPIARELSMVDFFHVDDDQVHDANSQHNQYVLVK